MPKKYLVLSSSIMIIVILLTACGASANQVAAPSTTVPAVGALAPTQAPVSSNTSQAQPTNAPAASTGSVSFTKDVMPIFESSCINCHGGESTKEGLDLKTYAALMAGSRNGSVVTPGNANDSYLVQQLLNGKMPKRGPRLSAAEIQTIVNWVNNGAQNN